MQMLFYLIVAYGLAFGFQNKVPFLYGKSAFLDALLRCTFCTGFHCGWMAWLLSWAASGHPPAEGWQAAASVLTWAFAAAGFSYAVDAGVQWLESKK